LSVGNIVEAMVLSVDVPKKRISLSIKRLDKNPWDACIESTQGQSGESPEGISD